MVVPAITDLDMDTFDEHKDSQAKRRKNPKPTATEAGDPEEVDTRKCHLEGVLLFFGVVGVGLFHPLHKKKEGTHTHAHREVPSEGNTPAVAQGVATWADKRTGMVWACNFYV